MKGMEWRLTKKFCDQDISWSRKFVVLNISFDNKNDSFDNKNESFDRKNRCLTMKLEPVLTMKIVDNFVRFGMP